MTDVHKPAQGAARDRGSCRIRELWGIPRLTGQDLSYHPSEGTGPAPAGHVEMVATFSQETRSSVCGDGAEIRSGSGSTSRWLGRAGGWHPMVSLGQDRQPQAAEKETPGPWAGCGDGLGEAAEVHKGPLAPSGPWWGEGGEQLFGDSMALLVDTPTGLGISACIYGVCY